MSTVCPGCRRTKSRRARLCARCRVTAYELGVVRLLEQDPMSDGQRKALNAKAAELGRLLGATKSAMKAKAYEVASKHFDREITSSKQLTWFECDWILDQFDEVWLPEARWRKDDSALTAVG
jgi:hypothetical protein